MITDQDQIQQLRNELDKACNRIKELETGIEELYFERNEAKTNYERACKTVAQMHEAAVGEVRGPIRGVVEDVTNLRKCMMHLDEENKRLQAENSRLLEASK